MTGLPPRAEWWRHAARYVWLPDAREMAELDRVATSSGSIPERALIENAGREVARLVQARWPEGRVVALAGSGHNGADALVALRCLAAWGRPVRAVRCGRRAPEPEVLRGWEIPVASPQDLETVVSGAAVLLDGMLGTGLSGPPRAPLEDRIETANASGVPIVAVDGPSGADFSTGAVPGACIRAALTVSLGWPKLGLLRFPARAYCGDLIAVEIGFPPPASPPGARLITAAWVRESMLAGRRPDAHKGESGYLTLIAGQLGMAGAAVLAARAAVRAGAGIVKVVSDPGNREILQAAVPEAVFVDWTNGDAVREAVRWSHALAVGPGLGRAADRLDLLELAFSERDGRTVVVDADGLFPWAERPERLAEMVGKDAVLTPHPGELARLIGRRVEEVVADPAGTAWETMQETGCVVLLKGAPTLIAVPNGPLRVSPISTAAFATGGTGDVLTGVIGAYLAGGQAPADAASTALLLTGLAAVEAPEPVGHSAADLPDRLPALRRRISEPFASRWGAVLFASPAPDEPAISSDP